MPNANIGLLEEMRLEAAALLEVQDVYRAFPKPGGGELSVLEGVDLTLTEGEIVGLLGRSGSGK